jgi:hypothetical protein
LKLKAFPIRQKLREFIFTVSGSVPQEPLKKPYAQVLHGDLTTDLTD